ncbi:ORF6N domain-containing protein [Photorhabdus khanii NC19]|uniref:ORF6N domain-containing protein n=1 Tax=Photorhabdus khanii NC19 TaxID=1004151 RepID=W3V5E7_9GAMM|nr:ORF6N domain-containing protein [Photorhabdus khanii NC19]
MSSIAINEMHNTINAENLPVITHNSIPVITTELLAKLYGTEIINIQVNFSRHADRFIAGKHYFKLEGEELRELKRELTQSKSVEIARNVRALTLWTERGAARHAKMLETDQAWDVFEALEDFYFNQKEGEFLGKQQELPVPHKTQFTDEELCSLCWLWRNAVEMISSISDVYPILRAAEHRLAGKYYSMQREYPRNTNIVRRLLERETAHIECASFIDNDWRVLHSLRIPNSPF